MALLVVSTVALFKDDSAVFKLTAKNFQSTVVDSDEFWLVEFYGKSRLIKPLGAVTARNLLLNMRKLLRFWMELSELEPLIWTKSEKLESLIMFRDIRLSNSSGKIKASHWPLNQESELSISLCNTAFSNLRVR